MAPRPRVENLDQQIGRMSEALDRVGEDRKEFLETIGKLDASVTGMSGMIAEMRAAFAGMIRRQDDLEKDGDRCEKLEKRVDTNECRLDEIEHWRMNRRKTMAAISTSLGAVGGSVATAIIQLIWHH